MTIYAGQLEKKMFGGRLKIDTTVSKVPNSSSGIPSRDRSRTPLSSQRSSPPSFSANAATGRMRSASSASTSSTYSVVSPVPSSTNASSSSLHLPSAGMSSVSTSPTSSQHDDTLRAEGEFVLAMHDFAPQGQNATCLSFRAGQVIHVLNRDPSGWWDGELDGRRGWFPSNYVNSDVQSPTNDHPRSFSRPRTAHSHTMSSVSGTPWASGPSAYQRSFPGHHYDSETDDFDSDDSYCPPMMIPLLHGLSLLQSAVRSNRISHFQPSTACIISCVRSILSSTECLSREAPVLQKFPSLAQERKRILSVLAALVAQAKKASEGVVDAERLEVEVEAMLRLSGQVFAHVRRFLAVAVQCGVQLPERRQSTDSALCSTQTEGLVWTRSQDSSLEHDENSLPGEDSTLRLQNGKAEHSHRRKSTARPGTARPGTARPGPAMRAKSTGDLRNQKRYTIDDDSSPLLPHRTVVARIKREQYLSREQSPGHKPGELSVVSTSSSSSLSSVESSKSPTAFVFPSGPSTAAAVMEALRSTHDQYLSTIAAFIGHAHSHSRSSHASSTGHMYDLVREVVEMVCRLLTIVEAVMHHPDVPSHKVNTLKAAKEGLYIVTSALADSVRGLTVSLPPTTTEEEEKASLLRSATGALKAGADCVAAVKMCLSRSVGEVPFVIQLPTIGEFDPVSVPMIPNKLSKAPGHKANTLSALQTVLRMNGVEDEQDLTIQAQTPSSVSGDDTRRMSIAVPEQVVTLSYKPPMSESQPASPALGSLRPSLQVAQEEVPEPCSPVSFAFSNKTDDDRTTWEGSVRHHFNTVSAEPLPSRDQDVVVYNPPHDHGMEDVAYNSEGHLVGATLDVLVEKMTPHDSIVDPAFAAVFFLTFRLFASPLELLNGIIARYNIVPPPSLPDRDLLLWQRSKGIPVRLRVSNFIKSWLETYWRSGVDDVVLAALENFTREALLPYFAGPSHRILDLIDTRRRVPKSNPSPKGDRSRDPGMLINPPSTQASEIPRPTMTKALLSNLRSKNFTSIAITDFDTLELARQLTIMECNLYCAIQPEEILETGQEGGKTAVNVKALSTLSTVITGWVAESILDEHDTKKRTLLVKFFIKVADRCTSLQNFSTSRSILAALDSSTISRLHQTWQGLPQKNKLQLESLRRLADHSRNYHEYRSRLRNTAPPAVPFLGLYLTDVTFCREGNPSHRTSPLNTEKKLLNFNKYHKLARIVQDMQRFQVPYNLKAIPEVQEYLNVLFEKSKHHGDLQDLYRRSLMVEPKQPADTVPPSDVRQLFNWATRSQTQSQQVSQA